MTQYNTSELIRHVKKIAERGELANAPERQFDAQVVEGGETYTMWIDDDSITVRFEGRIVANDAISWADKTARLVKRGVGAIMKKALSWQPSESEMIECDCGHTVAAGLVMNASLGSSCSECYDRMSD